jgi:hypothetical protein
MEQHINQVGIAPAPANHQFHMTCELAVDEQIHLFLPGAVGVAMNSDGSF